MRKLTAFQALLGTILLVSSFSIFIRPALAIPYANVSVQQGKAMIDSNPSVAILDLRNQSEYDSGHIGNARLIPVWNLTQNLDKLNKSDTILVYCNQDNRSTDASEILVSNGFSNICNMIGGIDAWALAGYPEYVKYSSIQEAIDDATEGSTIFISTGYYFEHLTINKSITLVGENRYTTMIDGNNSGTILSIASDNVSITDLTVEWACACHGSYGTLIEPNHSGISLIDNEMINDGVAINATFATNLVIAKNNFSSGSDLSMAISNSSNVLITGNNMDGFFQGLEITGSSNLTFSFNVVTGTVEGIFLQNSNGSLIRGNTFTQDSCGISLHQSSGNIICDNNFNGNFTRYVASQQSVNQWDDGVEGNFWGNYTGIDANLDGVGDTPYVIDANNTDKHPLAGMFASYDVSNQEVDCMSNSSIKSCNFKINNSTQGVLALSVSAPNGTQGFCRIHLPVELINGSLAVTLDEQIITEPQTHILPSSNENYTLVYISYSPSEHTIEIIGATSVPEWPINLLWITVMLTTLLASAAIGKICLPRKQEENRQAATRSDTSEF